MSALAPSERGAAVARRPSLPAPRPTPPPRALNPSHPHQGVEFWAINTDAQALAHHSAPNKLQIGNQVTRGLGCGGNPELGRQAAQESQEALKKVGGPRGLEARPRSAGGSSEAGPRARAARRRGTRRGGRAVCPRASCAAGGPWRARGHGRTRVPAADAGAPQGVLVWQQG
jgi:hypothetical protein